VCHNDLFNAHLPINNDAHLYVLAWEYAAMGDPFFDLANFSAQHEFSDQQDILVLDAYFGEATPSGLERLALMKITSDCREAMWALIQTGISQLDFDFPGYANKHFERLTQNLKDPQYEQWLVGVQLEARQARST
jgi:thiamine kinase-like enzyme